MWTFTVNGYEYNQGYYLADVIYPRWLVCMKTIPRLESSRCAMQEGAQKDVERAFEVLKARFHILVTSRRSFSQQVLSVLIHVYIILYNITIEDEYWESYDIDDCETFKPFIASPTVTLEAPTGLQLSFSERLTLHVTSSTPKWFNGVCLGSAHYN
jgi:hypothetical protein